MKIKRILIVAMAAVMVTLAGCDNNAAEGNDQAGTDEESTEVRTEKGTGDISEFAEEYKSNLDYQATVDSLKIVLETGGWKVSNIHDLQKTLQKHGTEVLPVVVMEVCNPEYSGQMLSSDEMRFMSVVMPCRVAVYEKSNGEIYVAMMNTVAMANVLDNSLQQKLKMIQEEIEQKVMKVVE